METELHGQALEIIYGNPKLRNYFEYLLEKYRKDFIDNEDVDKFLILRERIKTIESIINKSKSKYQNLGISKGKVDL